MTPNQKRERLAEIAATLRAVINPRGDIESVVVVVGSTDGEFVGIAANVCTERANEILVAAATRDGHVDHPIEPGVFGVDTATNVSIEDFSLACLRVNDGVALHRGHKMLLVTQSVQEDNGPVVFNGRLWVKVPHQIGDVFRVMLGNCYAGTYWVCLGSGHFVRTPREAALQYVADKGLIPHG